MLNLCCFSYLCMFVLCISSSIYTLKSNTNNLFSFSYNSYSLLSFCFFLWPPTPAGRGHNGSKITLPPSCLQTKINTDLKNKCPPVQFIIYWSIIINLFLHIFFSAVYWAVSTECRHVTLQHFQYDSYYCSNSSTDIVWQITSSNKCVIVTPAGMYS